MAEPDIREILAEAEGGEPLTRREIRTLLEISAPDAANALFEAADRVRRRAVGDEVHVRALIEISNHCCRNCVYCGLRRGNTALKRFRMAEDEILAAAASAAALGCKTFVLQSGEDPALTAPRVARLVKEIKSRHDAAVTLSLGEYSREDFFMMREAGADRYLLKHETVDPALYRDIHPDMNYENRIRCLEWLKETGFQVGAGIMIGLPGQTVACIADDILYMRRMEVDMAGIGPFIPHPDTPLGGAAPGALEMTLKAIAVVRLAMPWVLMPATTAAGTIRTDGRERALRAGADVIMPDVTPLKYKELYAIYPNRAGGTDEPKEAVRRAKEMVAAVGRTVASGYGHSYRERRYERRLSHGN